MRVFVLVCLILALLAAGPVQAAVPTVLVADYRVTPAVLLPGDTGTITVMLRNTAESASQTETDVVVQQDGTSTSTAVTPIDAFVESVYLYGNGLEVLEGSYTDVGAIGPGQSFPLTFLVEAPTRAGIYFPEVWIRVRGAESVKYPLPVDVNSRVSLQKEPAITVNKTVPVDIQPGDRFSVSLDLTNGGLARADDVAVTLNTSGLSLAPSGPSNYFFDHIEAGEAIHLDLRFMTDENIPLGLNIVPLTVTYSGGNGTAKRQVETLGIPVVGRAELGVASIRTDPTQVAAGDSVDLTIRIENTGTADANSVQASIENVSLSGSKRAFMGTIEPNNDAPAIFSLQADEAGEFNYTLLISYTDDFGPHTTRQDLQLVVLEQSPSDLLIPIAIAIVLVAAFAIYWYRRRRET
ncbi:MAG: S-layer protein [Methanomicrobiales archaeon]|nr:S-layer protein [Methanomicrobiales archaeon]MDI6876649.1 S-layer protein [Methanomicrobiales archaeon]